VAPLMARRRLALVVPPDLTVQQVLEVDRDIGNPGNVWHDVTDRPEVIGGWRLQGGMFHPPLPPLPQAVAQQEFPDVMQMRRDLDALTSRVAALESKR